MTDLNRLKVSLTKHNAHKISRLLKDYPASQVFSKLDEVHAEAAQARKNLSVLPGDALPPVWSKVQALGSDAIDALVLVAIVFSHRDLISAMSLASARRNLSARVERGKQLKGKAYTNFARVIDQLGYATKLEYEGVTFNLKSMFQIAGLGPLVSELLELKLVEARWDQSNSLAAEATNLGWHNVFGIQASDFRAWLTRGAQPSTAGDAITSKDEGFFEEETEGPPAKDFVFKPGHEDRDIEPLSRSASKKSKTTRLHNEIQNKLYAYLKGQLGPKCVGTEQDTGSGTAVDLVTRKGGKTVFYEIKTGPSVRTSIRQALPQLLEYAYWPADRRADELIIVSHLPTTKTAERYVQHLRKQFNLPLSYKQFDLRTKSLK